MSEPGFSKHYFLYVELEEEEGGTLARKVGEAVTNTIGVVVTAIDIPLGECCPKPVLKKVVMHWEYMTQ